MVEDMSVAEQTHEIINLEHALADAEMKLPEKFLVMSIVDKFFKSWKSFGMTVKHQKGRLSLDDFMIAISIDEEHRNQTYKMSVEHQPRTNLIVGKQKVNVIIFKSVIRLFQYESSVETNFSNKSHTSGKLCKVSPTAYIACGH
ncbi:UNVERIFIED_CONTAM: hypothetical protein Slati_4260700 [Sesamum latifolium]|uniref:Uncharacterized protein n=1 Tax=Sesamum latifolium TaxID=2727402 RepID=A0AAW2TCN3_9LAMI